MKLFSFLFVFIMFSRTRNNSCITGAFKNIENHIHKQPDPKKLPVDHTKFCSVRGSSSRSRDTQRSIRLLSHCAARAYRQVYVVSPTEQCLGVWGTGCKVPQPW